MERFERFVALGDSQTEGLNDRVDGRVRGWADRFAEHLATTSSPDLTYANLAVSGCRARHVRDVQLPRALELRPDLATVAVGMNDLLRHDFDLDATLEHVEATFAALVATGAVVATMTFPDLKMMLPVMGWLRPREARLNDGVRAAAARHGVRVLELFEQSMCADPRLWSHDRIHGSTEGHRRIGQGMAELFALPGADPQWSEPLPDPPRGGLAQVVRRDAWWAATFVAPFLVRQLRNRPSGERTAKRPVPAPVLESPSWTPPGTRGR